MWSIRVCQFNAHGRTHRPITSCSSSVRKVFLLDILLAHWWVFLCYNFTFARLLLLLLLLWLCLGPINHVKCCNKSGGGGILPQWGGGNAFFASTGCAGRQAGRARGSRCITWVNNNKNAFLKRTNIFPISVRSITWRADSDSSTTESGCLGENKCTSRGWKKSSQ